MVDLFLQIGFPLLLFAPSLLSIVYLYYFRKKQEQGISLRALALSVISTTAIVAASGAIAFHGEGNTELLLALPSTTESFEVSLNLVPSCFYWILGACFLWAFQIIFWPKDALSGEQPSLRYLYWLGAFFSGLIVFLAGQVVMGLIFAEIGLFLMHAYHLLDGGVEGQSARLSYFKRSALIFIGLILMMILFLAGAFSVDAIILFGAALYVVATVLSRSDYQKWSNVTPNIYTVLVATFLFMRVLQPGLASELWIPLALLFTFFALLFSTLSIMALSGINAYYWWSMGLLCHLFSLQFSSGAPAGHAWIILSIFFLLSISAIAGLLEMILGTLSVSAKRGLRVLVIGSFMQLVGAIPGLGSALEVQHPLNYILATHAFLVFVLSVSLVKILFLPKSSTNTIERGQRALMGMIAVVPILVVVQFSLLFVLGRSGDISGEWLDLDPTKYLPPLIFLGLVIMGVISAFLLAKNQKYFAFLSRRNQKREGYLQDVDPVYARLNGLISAAPQASADYLAGKAALMLDRISVAGGYVEEKLLQRGIWQEGNVYLSALSRYVRYFHRGSIRFYMFAAIVFFLIWSVFLIFI